MTESTQVVGTGYIQTIQGVCKLLEAGCSLLAAILVGSGFYGGPIDFFLVAASFSIIISVVLFILYVTKIIERINLQFNRIQFFTHLVLALLYIIAVAVLLDRGGKSIGRIIAGCVFGLFATLTHIFDAVDNYKKQPLW